MVSMSYNDRERRLVLEGPCWPGDGPRVVRAIREHAEEGRSLVLDLTRLSSVPDDVAAAVSQGCRSAELAGGWVSVWTPPGSTTAGRLPVESDPAVSAV